MRAGIYIRKSRRDKKSQAFRLQAQRTLLPEFAQKQGWDYEIYDDAFASASRGKANCLKERARLEADIRAGKIAVVLVIEVSRLSRDESLLDYAVWLDLLKERNVKLATLSQIFDLNQPNDLFNIHIQGSMSAAEMGQSRVRMQEGRAIAIASSKWIWGAVPLPYRYNREERRVVLDEAFYPVMQRILKLAETRSAKSIAQELGLPEIFVRRSLSDDRLLFYQGKKRIRKTGTVQEGDWEPIITSEEADRISAARRTRKTNGDRREFAAMLSALNLLICGYCNNTVKTWRNSKVRKDGGRCDYYGCRTKNSKGDCPKSRLVPQTSLDERVLTNVFHSIQSLEELMQFWLASRGNKEIDEELGRLDREEQQVRQGISRIVAAIAGGVIELDDARQERRRLDIHLDKINMERSKLASQRTSPPNWECLQLSREEFEHLDPIDQRRFLQAVLESIRVYDSYAILTYRFPRNSKGDCTARVHLPPPARGCSKGRTPRIGAERGSPRARS